MGNQLTGEFDVVAEFGVTAVNRILAAQHQESGSDQIYLHSIRSILREDVLAGVWGIAEIQISTPTISLHSDSSPPVVAAFAAAPAPTDTFAQVAVETALPTVGLLPGTDLIFGGAGSKVTIHFQIRVRFRPDLGSASAPEFVHGELRISVSPDQVVSSSANVVAINLDDHGLTVSFTPDAGAPLSSAGRSMVTRAARHIIRNSIGALNFIFELPPVTDGFGLSHWRFKTFPHNSRAAVALLLNMSPDRIPTKAHRESYDNLFLEDSDGFAFAIGSDFLIPTLRGLLDEQIQQEVVGNRYTVNLFFPLSDRTYEIGLGKKPTEVTLEQGAIKISISLTASGSPNIDLTLTQSIGLSATAGIINLELVDDLNISFSFSGGIWAKIANLIKGLFKNKVKNAVSNVLVQVVNKAQPLLDKTLSAAKVLTEKLRIPPPHLTYNTVDISPAGITVHGDLTITNWRPVVVSFNSRRLLANPPQSPNSRLEFTALKSWIPGGTIQRYRWLMSSDVELVHEHQFTVQPSSELSPFIMWTNWCLEVSGVQDSRAVVASNCGLIGRAVVAQPGNGAGNKDLPLPVSVLDAAGNLVAHIDLSGSGGRRRSRDVIPANVLIHFAGSDAQATPALIRELLPQLELEDKSLLVISILKPGTLTSARRNESLGVLNMHLVWAEDFEGNWAKTFDVREGRPAILVASPDGILWRSSAKPEAGELIEALKQHLRSHQLPRLRMVQPSVREQESAPNFLFDYIPGTKMKLSTLRGRSVKINFFKSWSQPCLTELRRLQMLHERQGEKGSVILIVADGENGQQAQSLFEQYGIKLRIIADPDRKIARLYGILAWPTTITVNAGGFVQEIRSGASTFQEVLEDYQAHDK